MLVVKSGGPAAVPEWRECFSDVAPELEVKGWDDPSIDPQAVRYALVWDPEPGRLARFPNLRVIFGSGAGVDLIVHDPALPALPVIRCVPDEATQRMGEFICWAALSLLVEARRMAIGQARGAWDDFERAHHAGERRVGIMGLGAMGMRAAAMLAALGFPVIGWSRTPKTAPGFETYSGAAERDAFLARTDILVCLLPATTETRGIIAAPLLAKLPRGAQLVGAGRGVQHNMDDILAALDTGQLAGAVLDVFDPEPLPAGHRAWSHPNIIVTPHIASLPSRHERARYVATLIAAHERGEALPNRYDPARGY